MGNNQPKGGAKAHPDAHAAPEAASSAHPQPLTPTTGGTRADGQPLGPNFPRTVERAKRPATGIPTLIRWQGQAQAVSVTGTFNNWDPRGDPLTKGASEDEFVLVLHLEKGKHEFKFIVDGQVRIDHTQPTTATTEGVQNVIVVRSPEEADALAANGGSNADADDAEGRDGSGSNLNASDVQWGREETVFEETRKFPPLCPPHLCFTPLNTPPQMRCFGDAPLLPTTFGEDLTLPLPLHVTVNHVYFQRRDRYFLMGVTTRFANKYSTVVFYKKLEQQQQP